jgi:hypothetical protein
MIEAPDFSSRFRNHGSPSDCFYDRMPLRAKAGYAHVDHIAVCEESWRLHSQPHTSWSPGNDQVAGHQGHELTDVAHHNINIEDQVRCIALLTNLAIHLQVEVEGIRVEFIASDEPRSGRTEGVEALARSDTSLTMQ